MFGFKPQPLYPFDRWPSSQWTRSWFVPRVSPDISVRTKICCPLPGLELRTSGRPTISLVTKLTKLSLKIVGRVPLAHFRSENTMIYVTRFWIWGEFNCVIMCVCQHIQLVEHSKINTRILWHQTEICQRAHCVYREKEREWERETVNFVPNVEQAIFQIHSAQKHLKLGVGNS